MAKTTAFGFVSGLLMLASSLLAAPPGDPRIDLETAQAGCPAPESATLEEEPLLTVGAGAVVYTAGGCSAWASCADGSSVHCSTSSSSGTCSFQDSSCSPRIRGWVECNGWRTWCPYNECDLDEPDCSTLNYPGCSYFWNGVLECCDVKQTGPNICLSAC